ncbi:MAG: redoxin family protein [Methanoregulaceae archaeon]|nr:redoxin family protein [Methanoregulaceae archaeon]
MKKGPDKKKNKRDAVGSPGCAGAGIGLLLVAVLILVAGCTDAPGSKINISGDRLTTIELTDIGSGSAFTLSSFPDRPVLIQTFTLTCPVCMQQQKEITRLHESGKVPFVMVGLDIDPNGDTESLRAYTEKQGYYGLYARSPQEMTIRLVDRFGQGILAPSQAPLILICPGGSASLLPPGIKTADYLEKALSGC